MILRGTSDKNPSEIHVKGKSLLTIHRGSHLVWQKHKTLYYVVIPYWKNMRVFGTAAYNYIMATYSDTIVGVYQDWSGRYMFSFNHGDYRIYLKPSGNEFNNTSSPNPKNRVHTHPDFIEFDRYGDLEFVYEYRNPTYSHTRPGRGVCITNVTAHVGVNNFKAISVGYYSPAAGMTDDYFIDIVLPHVPDYDDII